LLELILSKLSHSLLISFVNSCFCDAFYFHFTSVAGRLDIGFMFFCDCHHSLRFMLLFIFMYICLLLL